MQPLTIKQFLFFIISIIMVFTVSYYYLYYKLENWISGTNIQFLDKSETATFIMEDSDNYVSQMSEQDLHARKSISIQEYLLKAANSAYDFTEPEKNVLEKDVAICNTFFEHLTSPYIDNKLMSVLPWKFSLTINNIYEDGLPHTRKDIIFLTPDILEGPSNKRIQTLIHEKVHIYQRVYKTLFQQQLLADGYQQWIKRKGYPRIRSNPDLDEFIYLHPSKEIMVAVYHTNIPKDIQDVIQPNELMEHPNEEIAYKVANQYNRTT